MGVRFPPFTANGGYRLLSRAVMWAPMRLRGLITLPIGLVLRERSPVKTEKKGLPARTPERRRIVVPELPQSITSEGSDNPCSPLPCIVKVEPSSLITIPRLRNAFTVLSVSCALRKFLTVLVPFVREEKMTDLWDIDLSGGGANSPLNIPALPSSILSKSFPQRPGLPECMLQRIRITVLEIPGQHVQVFLKDSNHLDQVIPVQQTDIIPQFF